MVPILNTGKHSYLDFNKRDQQGRIISEYSKKIERLIDARGWGYHDVNVKDLVAERVKGYYERVNRNKNSFAQNVAKCMQNKLSSNQQVSDAQYYQTSNECYEKNKRELEELVNLAEVKLETPEYSSIFSKVAQLNGINLEHERVAEAQRQREIAQQRARQQNEEKNRQRRLDAAKPKLRGKYVKGGDYWVFNGRSGEFWQTKSINGQPGKIVINFNYSLNGNNLRYTQKRISLRDHPSARSQSVNKTFNERIEIGRNYIVIGGKRYNK